MNPTDKISVCLVSDANFLAVNILEGLLSRNCVVNIVTDTPSEWEKETSQISLKSRFAIIPTESLRNTGQYSYIIFCGGFLDKANAYSDYQNFAIQDNFLGTKTLLIFPAEVYDRNKVDRIKIDSSTAVLFIGDLLGPRINLQSNLLISNAINEIVQKRQLTLGVGEVFYPLFVADVVRSIVKWLFSFGPYGKETYILGPQISGDTFWKYNQKLVGELRLVYDSKIRARLVPRGYEVVTINRDTGFSLSETYNWLKNNWEKYGGFKNMRRKNGSKRLDNTVPLHKNIKLTLLCIFTLLILPFLSLFISFSVMFLSYKEFMAGRDNTAGNLILAAKTFAAISEKESAFLKIIPGLRIIYKEIQLAALMTESTADIGIHAIPLIRESVGLFKNVLGDSTYEPSEVSAKINSDLILLATDATVLKAKVDTASAENVVLANRILSKVDFAKYQKLLMQGEIITRNMAGILGAGQSRTYLILFENNMELRPTGGFIGSYGLATFDEGRLSDLTVSDVYSADGQLNGHVEPPPPIKKYLGEANWWLRDSNWDPDFPTSAKRAEWFLDKEVGKQVDGVFAIDLAPIRRILNYTGPIFLPDFNMDITSANLYEKTQNEVESNFFPGTHRKASFLTALSRSLLTDVAKLDSKQNLLVLKSFYESLNERHLQIYLHDDVSQQAIYKLGWDGSVVNPVCGSDCYGDLVGVVEANVGVNKSNYFIKRSAAVNIGIGESEINRELALTLENSANTALGPSGKYKTYIRVIVPLGSSITSVKSYVGNSEQILSPEIVDAKNRREVGVLVEVIGGEKKSVRFNWRTQVGSSSVQAYGLMIRKQAGVDAYPIAVNVSAPGIPIKPDPRFSLTGSGAYRYNTTLAGDFFSRFNW